LLATFGATLALTSAAALAAKPVPPIDPCATVTEVTFPAFAYAKTIEVSPKVYETGTFLADETGKCARLIGTWPRLVDFRYNPDIDMALLLTTAGNDIVVGVSSITFGINGPVATPLSGPTPILDTTQIPVPSDLASTGWKYGAAIDRVDSNGRQLLFKIGLETVSGEAAEVGKSLVTCSLSYHADSTIKPIDPASCREVHRYGLTANWHEIAFWGALPGTIYSTHPSLDHPMLNSLYRVTVPSDGAQSVVEELFYTGGVIMGAKANLAPLGSAVTNGEIVAVFETAPNGTNLCAKVTVIDAYNCTGLNCPILNQKGMRSITWLPDGRLAGRSQTSSNKKGNGYCFDEEKFVAYPAIDSSNTPPTVLTTTTANPYNLCRTCIEGSGGGW